MQILIMKSFSSLQLCQNLLEYNEAKIKIVMFECHKQKDN